MGRDEKTSGRSPVPAATERRDDAPARPRRGRHAAARGTRQQAQPKPVRRAHGHFRGRTGPGEAPASRRFNGARFTLLSAGVVAVLALAAFGVSRLLPAGAIAQARISDASVAPSGLGSFFDKAQQPTPFFASFRGVKLRLPVPPQCVTAVAYHQASPAGPLAISSLVGCRSIEEAARSAARKRALKTSVAPTSSVLVAESASTYEDVNGVWTGKVLQLYRSGRVGKPNNAVDCGARPGTPVYSPVDGTVMEIRPYMLYGKYPDFEIHIKPDAWSDIDVIILHTTDPAVKLGQHVVAGLDQISHVRALSGKVPGIQLAEYTVDGGNHTHVQINRILKPGQTWVLGKDPPGLLRAAK
jgi:hypothetical protein